VGPERVRAGGGRGLGTARLAELEASVLADPRAARSALKRALGEAARDEIPRLLGLYGSCLRIESDAAHAELVLGEAREMARELDLPATEAEILIRLAYVAHEQERSGRALGLAQEATLGYARLGDRADEGRGFETLGMIRYYRREFQDALRDFEAALDRLVDPVQRLATHQFTALCHVAAGAEDAARHHLAEARVLAENVPAWIGAKLEWLEARLSYGEARLDHLRRAKATLCPTRPADCAQVTVELVEEALALGLNELATQQVRSLFGLLDHQPSPRVEKAVNHLIRHRTRLTPPLVARIRRALDRAHRTKPGLLIQTE
jgi:tetratricopeptide (TPR) repeat protein